MSSRRHSLERKPFHDAIVEEMDAVGRDAKDAGRRAVTLARLVRRTKSPANRESIRGALASMFDRLGGYKHKRFTTADRAEYYGAIDALDAQDAACVAEMRAETEQPRLPGVTEPAAATADLPG